MTNSGDYFGPYSINIALQITNVPIVLTYNYDYTKTQGPKVCHSDQQYSVSLSGWRENNTYTLEEIVISILPS